jgi:hypothetical protein
VTVTENSDDQLRQHWGTIASSSEAWLRSGLMLKRAADELAPTFQAELQATVRLTSTDGGDDELTSSPPPLGPTYMMLAGLAVENLAKALIVSRRPAEATRITNFHLNERLLKEAEVESDYGELDLVRRLRTFLIWAGRYPVPKQKDTGKYEHRGIWDTLLRHSTNDVILVDALFDRMERQLAQQLT